MALDNVYTQIGIREIRNLYRNRLMRNPVLREFVRGIEDLDKVLSRFYPNTLSETTNEADKKFRETDIYLKMGKLYEDGKILVHFPIVPAEITLGSQSNLEEVKTPQGIVNFIREYGLKTISWSSFFPSKAYSFSKNDELSEWDLYDEIEKIRMSGEPVELIITGTRINMQVAVSSFNIKTEGSGDISYDIEFKEFVYPGMSQEIDKTDYYKPEETTSVEKTKVRYSQKDGKPIFKDLKIGYTTGR